MTAQMQTTTLGSVGYPGLGFRYCVVDFQFPWSEFPAETLRRREFGWINGKVCAHVEVAV